MFGITWLTPKCLVREIIHRKHHHYLYISCHFDNGLVELWAIQAKSPFKGSKWQEERYSLGKVMAMNWYKPKNFYDLDRSMQTMAEWVYRKKLQGKEIDLSEIKEYSKQSMKKTFEKKRVWTREDFVKAGASGQAKVREMYGKGSVFFRTYKTKKVK